MRNRVSGSMLLLVVMLVCLVSCRRVGNMIYDPQDPYYKAAMFSTLEGQWEYIWQAMDNSYVFWDMDNTDWDALYDEYLDKFKAMDVLLDSVGKAYDRGDISFVDYVRINKEQMSELIAEDLEPRLASLVDQHLVIRFYNVYEGLVNPFYSIQPSGLRLARRPDFHPSVTHNAIVRKDSCYHGIDYIYDGIKRNYNVTPEYAREESDSTRLWAYSCRIGEGVFYLRLGSYFLSELPKYKELGRLINPLFDSIASAASDGTLNGIILDNRGNPGGKVDDLGFFPGKFITSSFKVAERKTKNGLGRYDYSAYVGQNVEPSSQTVDIEGVPFVILQDMYSASMGEFSGYACSLSIPSAVIIGERSMGATGSLITEYPDIFHAGPVNYTNNAREPYIYTSTYSTRMYDKCGQWVSLEGIGVEPDIYCPLDYESLAAGGRDTQLDCAIEYIHK